MLNVRVRLFERSQAIKNKCASPTTTGKRSCVLLNLQNGETFYLRNIRNSHPFQFLNSDLWRLLVTSYEVDSLYLWQGMFRKGKRERQWVKMRRSKSRNKFYSLSLLLLRSVWAAKLFICIVLTTGPDPKLWILNEQHREHCETMCWAEQTASVGKSTPNISLTCENSQDTKSQTCFHTLFQRRRWRKAEEWAHYDSNTSLWWKPRIQSGCFSKIVSTKVRNGNQWQMEVELLLSLTD